METIELPPLPSHFTRAIAGRSFVLRDASGLHPLHLEIGEPIQDVVVVNAVDWRCPLRITHANQSTVRSGIGVDSLQALQLAMTLARLELEKLASQPGASLEYLGQLVDLSSQNWLNSLL